MKAFLDTSVLVAAFYEEHERHERSFKLLVSQDRTTGCTSAHCLAEVYSVTTGMPGKDRATPAEALLFLTDVRDRLKTLALNDAGYFAALEKTAANGNVTGGAIYDALHAETAVKANAEYIYTWNVKHFTRLGPDIARRVRTPP